MERTAVARQFVDAINSHDLNAICALMTEGHRFVDSLGAVFESRDAMRVGWSHYFRMVPDYTIHVDHCFENGPRVVLLGTAGGTYTRDGVLREEGRWSTPAAFCAIVEQELIAEWHVYADNEPIRRCMAASEWLSALCLSRSMTPSSSPRTKTWPINTSRGFTVGMPSKCYRLSKELSRRNKLVRNFRQADTTLRKPPTKEEDRNGERPIVQRASAGSSLVQHGRGRINDRSSAPGLVCFPSG